MWNAIVNSESFAEFKEKYISNKVAEWFIRIAFILTLYPLCLSYIFNLFRDYGLDIPNVPYIAAVLISIVAQGFVLTLAVLMFIFEQFGILAAFFGS
jgi:hypothetical protein